MSEYNKAEEIRIKATWKGILGRVRNFSGSGSGSGRVRNEREKSESMSLLRDEMINNNNSNHNDRKWEGEKENGRENENENERERERDGERKREKEREKERERDNSVIRVDDTHGQHSTSYFISNNHILGKARTRTDELENNAKNSLLRTYGVLLSDSCTGQTLLQNSVLL